MRGANLGLSEIRDLRTGTVPWDADHWRLPASSPLPQAPVDVAILGSGIMGATLAERLTADGLSVAVLDRRSPGHGSTAASTAEIMWAMDVPMIHLARELGEAEAARRWIRVFQAVRRFSERINSLGIDGRKVERSTVYLEGDVLDADGLRAEAAMHRRHELPSRFLDPYQIAERFGIAPRAAIVSEGGFEIDPVRLSHALLACAQARGATVSYPVDIVALHHYAGEVALETADGGAIRARDVIVATGYERTPLFLPAAFTLLSTFAIATQPGLAPLWRENVMIWEAADPYLYVRTDIHGRVIAGGEDIEQSDVAVRDALIGAKAGVITAKLEALLGTSVAVDRAWAATFGSSPDGLPAIGPAALMPHVWLSAGYGGNGIAFAALAAELLSRTLAGKTDPDADAFDPHRFDR